MRQVEGHVLLGGHLEAWAYDRPDAEAQVFLEHDRRASRRSVTTFRELEAWSRVIASRLGDAGQPGDRVAILSPPGLSYVASFLGALRSGLIGVPLFAPGLPGHGSRLERVLEDCDPAAVLTTSAASNDVARTLAAVRTGARVTVLCADALRHEIGQPDGGDAGAQNVRPHDVAYLQYTSGSTRAPHGVVLTHENLMANVEQLVAAFEPVVGGSQPQAAVSWLPMFHDMGLVLSVAMPIVVGCAGVTFDPLEFVQRPARWMRALSGWSRAYSAAPNFAFGLAASRVREQDLPSLDLSGVHAILNGAEPVTAAAIDAFTTRFSPCGLRAEAVRPAYGLAEATVFVAATRPRTPPSALAADTAALQRNRIERAATDAPATAIVAHGTAWGQDLLIVEPQQHVALDDGAIGELWVRGPNVGRGYWGNPEESEAAFGGWLESAPADRQGPWLRTGDLGGYFEGELYITGRRKDLILIDGRNIYPQDIEHSVEQAHPVVAAHRAAAFSVRDDRAVERLVVVAEVHRDASPDRALLVAACIAAVEAVSSQHAVALWDVVLVGPHGVPRTSSGKIARAACRDLFLEGALDPVLSASHE